MKKDEYSKIINGLSDRELLFHLYLTQMLLLAISFILGIFLFDNLFKDIIALFNWSDPLVWQLGLTAGIIVVCIDLLLMKVLPTSMYDDGGLNKRIFRNRHIVHIAFISALVAFSEEILFRGVIQSHFGLILSSLIFALVHYRYLFNWVLLINIIFLSFVIGFIFFKTGNLAITVIMHFFIDFLLGVFYSYRKNRKEEGMFNE